MTAVVGLVGKLQQLSLAMLKQALEDWAQMANLQVAVADAKVQNVAKREQLAKTLTGPVILIETRVEGRCEGPCFFVFPLPMAATAVGKFVMLPEDAIAKKSAQGFDDTDLEAFREMANLLCGSSNNVIAKQVSGVRLSQNVAALRVEQGLPDITQVFASLPATDIACVVATVQLEGKPYTALHLMPLAVTRTMLA